MRVLTILFLIVTGCADYSNTYELEGFDDTEKEVIQAAIDTWCDASQGDHCGHIGHNTEASSISLSDETGRESGDYGVCILGPNNIDDIIIYDNKDKEDWLAILHKVTLHELGHHYRGKGHLPKGQGYVMDPCGKSIGSVLTKKDLDSEYDESITCHSDDGNPKK